ncbi:uncharacterized protein LOC131181994 [Hevea brasiliensis]|uniref:uncharacterized protein LOC131181994 n=1 Tax=Hevea brasiliensis TaxID=3981 RepID=UPI0025FD1107|nr:uncharacterized protein LOC131181994 [Hevea brasiliensis]
MEMYDDERWAGEQRKRFKKDGQGNQFNREQSHQGSYQGNKQGSQSTVGNRAHQSGVGQGREQRTHAGNARYSQISIGPISTPCQHCGKLNKGTCHWVTGACFGCRQMGHRRQDCPTSGTTQGAGQAAYSTPSQVQPVSQYSGRSHGSGGHGQGGRGSGGRGSAQTQRQTSGGRGQARVFALTGQDA